MLRHKGDRLKVILHEPGLIVCSTSPDGLVSALLHQAVVERILDTMASNTRGWNPHWLLYAEGFNNSL